MSTPKSKHKWTRAELDRLTEYYPRLHMSELVKMFEPHSAAAIYGKAYNIGIRRSDTYVKAVRRAKSNANVSIAKENELAIISAILFLKAGAPDKAKTRLMEAVHYQHQRKKEVAECLLDTAPIVEK